MDLTQMQWEAINKAHSEGGVEVDSMARLLLLPKDALRRDIDALVEIGLLRAADERYTLTSDGEATWKGRAASETAAVKQATRSWPPR